MPPMKAYVLHDMGNFRLETVSKPVLKSDEVLVKVKATGICGSDISRIYKTGAHVHPLIPGHEFSGVVVKVGNEVNNKWLGKAVGVFPLIPCYSCNVCKKRKYEMCRNYSYLGSRRNGGFAEYVAVPDKNLIEKPKNVSFEEMAMLEPMSVAVHAMRRINPYQLETVVVYGLGTIGLLLLMFLIESGVKKILTIGNKDFQRECVVSMGAEVDDYCDSRIEDVGLWLKEKTSARGADVVFECVGKNETFVQSIDSSAPGGKIILVGNPYSDVNIDKQVYWKILRNQLQISGSWNSSFTHDVEDDWHYALDRLERKSIIPSALISHKYSLTDLKQGLQIMKDKSEEYVKIMAILD